MKNNILKRILIILNNTKIPLINKKEQLIIYNKSRRGYNRKTIDIVTELLSAHSLPIQIDQKPYTLILKNIEDQTLANLGKILKSSEESFFSATCGELLWMKLHKTEFANISISNYSQQMYYPSSSDQYSYTRMALGIARIYSKYKSPQLCFDKYFDDCITYFKENHEDSGYCSLFILHGLICCNLRLNDIKQSLLDEVVNARNKRQYKKAREYNKTLISLFKKTEHTNSDIDGIRMEIALDFENEANTYDWTSAKNAHNIIYLMQQGMNVLSNINDSLAKEERKRLAKRIQHVEPLALENMESISLGSLDISSIVSEIKNNVETMSFEEIVFQISQGITLIDAATVQDLIKETESITYALFPTVLIDEDGRKRCKIPSSINANDEEIIAILEYSAYHFYSFYAEIIIQRYIWFARENFEFSKENLRILVEHNSFIPESRKESFLTGLVAGFNLDLVTAMHILMPQVENAIRLFAEACGAVTYKTNYDGTEECLSMESILKLPEVIECFDESFLFNLKVFYTSKYGIGMRNIIAHGLDSDKALQSVNGLSAWWFTLHICCEYSFEFQKLVIQKSKARKDKKEINESPANEIEK